MKKPNLERELLDDLPAFWGGGIGAAVCAYAHVMIDKFDLVNMPWNEVQSGLGGLIVGAGLGLIYKEIRNYQIKRKE